jgi:hypothetical protein
MERALIASAIQGTKSDKLMHLLYPEADMEAMTPTVIKSAWRDVGLWPYQRDKVIARFDSQFGPAPSPQANSLQGRLVATACIVFDDLLDDHGIHDDATEVIILRENQAVSDHELLNVKDRRQAEVALTASNREEANVKKRKREEDLIASSVDLKRRRLSARGRDAVDDSDLCTFADFPHCEVCASQWVSSKAWYCCPKCTKFRLCPAHRCCTILKENHIASCGKEP